MILMFGLAGSGKSTQGQLLAEKYDMEWISVGEVIRRTGRFVEETKNGELIPDDAVIAMMNDEIARVREQGKNAILDGYPRDKTQAEYVAAHLAEQIEDAVFLEVPKEELWARLKERAREDDTEEAIKRRFEATEQNIQSILDLLRQKDIKIHYVDGVGPVPEITKRLEEVLNLN